MASAKPGRTRRIRSDRTGTWELYREPDGRWRWKRIDEDGEVIALSPQSYRHLLECLADARADGCTEGRFRFMSWPG